MLKGCALGKSHNVSLKYLNYLLYLYLCRLFTRLLFSLWNFFVDYFFPFYTTTSSVFGCMVIRIRMIFDRMLNVFAYIINFQSCILSWDILCCLIFVICFLSSFWVYYRMSMFLKCPYGDVLKLYIHSY